MDSSDQQGVSDEWEMVDRKGMTINILLYGVHRGDLLNW